MDKATAEKTARPSVLHVLKDADRQAYVCTQTCPQKSGCVHKRKNRVGGPERIQGRRRDQARAMSYMAFIILKITRTSR